MRKILFLSVVGIILAASASYAADETATLNEDEKLEIESSTVKTKEGLTFRVPKDMPIEMRNGIQAPIPIEEYMYAKFKRVEKKIGSLEGKLDNIENLLIELKEKAETKEVSKTSGKPAE